MKRAFAICLLLCSFLLSVAGESLLTTLVGEVYDASTGQPIENVNLSLTGTRQGTTTNAEGIFLLRAELSRRTTLTVSAIGYKTQHFKIEPGLNAGIDIALEEKTTYLQDVFVIPGSNPALPLMARVRERRKANEAAYAVPSEAETTDVFVSDINARHLRRRFWQQLKDGLIPSGDSTFLLPLYHSETRNGQTASRAVLLPKEEFQAQLDYLQSVPDFYKNTIPFYGTNFLSPLAAEGNTFYHFYLVDSLQMAGQKAYIVDFRTKNPYYPTFNGRMTIDSLSCAILDIEATVPQQVNANYLRALTFRQHFATVADGQPTVNRQSTEPLPTLERAETDLLLDYALRLDTTRTLPTILIRHRIEQQQPLSPQEPEHPLHKNEAHDTQDSLLQNVADLPLIRVADFFAHTILTGYIPAGKWLEVGNVNQFFRVTPQEGVRVGVGLRTSERLMKNVCLDAYAGYGFRDQSFKGGAGLHLNLPTPRRHQLHFQFSDDYLYLDRTAFGSLYLENAALFRQRDFTTALTQAFIRPSRSALANQLRVREFRFTSSNDWTAHLEQDFYASLSSWPTWSTGNTTTASSFALATVGTTLRYSFDETKVDLFFRRIHVYGRLPVLLFGLETGTFQTPDMPSYQLYGRLNFMIRQQVPLGVMGTLDYLFEAGMVLGNVPATMCKHFSGNESVSYAFDRFTLMNNLQYSADRYLLLHAHWNGRGCLFNLIPGIRVLRLRELATFKLAWGRQTNENRPSDDLFQPLNTPYIEMGVGLGNILRICNILSVWRLTHRHEPASPDWAIRFQFSLEK